jgi:predicted XRE-type DNA-binding protein
METENNIFSDLGLIDAQELSAKAKLLKKVCSLIKDTGFTQKQIAEKLGISQPKVSNLLSGRLSAFSSDTLLQYLALLGCDIQIKVREPKSISKVFGRTGHVAVC